MIWLANYIPQNFECLISFLTLVLMIPHPKKTYHDGEDAYFISQNHDVVSVDDGIDGQSKTAGVDPSY
jgi:hypothetical protein